MKNVVKILNANNIKFFFLLNILSAACSNVEKKVSGLASNDTSGRTVGDGTNNSGTANSTPSSNVNMQLPVVPNTGAGQTTNSNTPTQVNDNVTPVTSNSNSSPNYIWEASPLWAGDMDCLNEQEQVHTRMVSCKNTNSAYTYVADSFCTSPKPATAVKLNNPAFCGKYIGPFFWREIAPNTLNFTHDGTRCGGSGTLSDPFLICTVNDFVTYVVSSHSLSVTNGRINFNTPSAHYKMVNDIDLSKAVLPNHFVTEIGVMMFMLYGGSFDGDGHKLIFSSPVSWKWYGFGLFSAQLKNLTLVNPIAAGLGALGGSHDPYDLIDNCHVINGKIQVPQFSSGGGLVQYTMGTIQNSTFQGQIHIVDPPLDSQGQPIQGSSNPTFVGGIAGFVSSDLLKHRATIKNSIANFIITEVTNYSGDVAAGGIAGFNGSGSLISGNTSSGTIRLKSPTSYAGGVLGASWHGYISSTSEMDSYQNYVSTTPNALAIAPKYTSILSQNNSEGVIFSGPGYYSTNLGGCLLHGGWGDSTSYFCIPHY